MTCLYAGMMAGVYGGELGSMHDSRLFTESRLLQDLEEKMDAFEMHYRFYGDSGYGESALVRRLFSAAATIDDWTKREQNKAMSAVHQAVEWGFKEISTNFVLTDFQETNETFRKTCK